MQKRRTKFITMVGVALLLTGCALPGTSNIEPYKANITVTRTDSTGSIEIYLEDCEVISEDFLGTVTFKDSGGEEYTIPSDYLRIEKIDDTEESDAKDVQTEEGNSDNGSCKVGVSGCD